MGGWSFNKHLSVMLKLNIFCIKGKVLLDQTTWKGSFLLLTFLCKLSTRKYNNGMSAYFLYSGLFNLRLS